MTFDPVQLELLKQPLDRSRVKERAGRGSGSFSYLETHDVVRTANEIFGYGGWGHRIVVQDRIGEVEVTRERSGRMDSGWHVAYRCIVEVTVADCVPVSGSGYGDGVEYGPAARLTASELALKESESDALKRALKNYGDQFGLILYAKGEDQRRLESDQAADQAHRPGQPVTLEECIGKLNVYVEDAKPWIKALAEHRYKVEFKSFAVLSGEQRVDLLKRLAGVIEFLEGQKFDPYADALVTEGHWVKAVASAFEGVVVQVEYKRPIPF